MSTLHFQLEYSSTAGFLRWRLGSEAVVSGCREREKEGRGKPAQVRGSGSRLKGLSLPSVKQEGWPGDLQVPSGAHIVFFHFLTLQVSA